MAKTRAQENRAIRQEELRQKLAAGGHLQHALDSLSKLADLDQSLDATEVSRLKAVVDGHLKLVCKYLPDLKSTEIKGQLEHSYMMRSPAPCKDVSEWRGQWETPELQ